MNPNTQTPGCGKILRFKEGYNPNSSSVGSIVFAFPVAVAVIPSILGAVGAIVFSKTVKSCDADNMPELPQNPEMDE